MTPKDADFLKNIQIHRTGKFAERFYSYVKAGPKCWPWTGGTGPGGYGSFCWDGHTFVASRLAYFMAYGPLPDGKPFVCHSCDNPICCNPDHLFPGTAKDNSQDAKNKGRNARGERNGARKLTADIVREMRRRKAAGETGYALAKEFGVSHSSTCDAIKGETWAHVDR